MRGQIAGKFVTYTETDASRKYQFMYTYEIKSGTRQYIFVRIEATTMKPPMPKTRRRMIFCLGGIWRDETRGMAIASIAMSPGMLKAAFMIS